jgi:hypothetical protein
MSEQKTYVPRSSAKEVKFANGGSMMKLSFKADEFIAFCKANANKRGYINFGVTARREVGKFGDTHCVWLDTWEPEQKPQGTPAKPAQPKSPIDDDEPPF